MVNQVGAEDGIRRGCGETTLPIVQDVPNGLSTVLGGGYNDVLIFDREGALVHRVASNFPEASEEIVGVVTAILNR